MKYNSSNKLLICTVIVILFAPYGLNGKPFKDSTQRLFYENYGPEQKRENSEPNLINTHSLPSGKYSGDQCLKEEHLYYPISDPQYRSMKYDSPRFGKNSDRISQNCEFMNSVVMHQDPREMISKIEKHDPTCAYNGCVSRCDHDCDNRFLSELYESYLIKSILESQDLTASITDLHAKIFNGFKKSEIKKSYETWLKKDSYFPVNQKGRTWSLYDKKFIVQDLIGLSHDPTSILLSGGFLKHLINHIDEKFSMKRDYMFNAILKKARGYRTNQKKEREGMKETQIGITSFDYDELILDPRYYENKKWLHPGRSKCETTPAQGMYSNEAIKNFIPLKCGISGSTNFWVWTALYSGVNFTKNEVRLLLLSAFSVLGADGGHSLMEVLSSATITAIYLKHYSTYANDPYLTSFIKRSNFADNLYEVTSHINPLGNRNAMCIDMDKIAGYIYSNKRYQQYNDKKNPAKEELKHRLEIESFFLHENERYLMPFGDYTQFLDEINELQGIRHRIAKKLQDYAFNYCLRQAQL